MVPDLCLLRLSCCPSNTAAQNVLLVGICLCIATCWLLSRSCPLHPDLHHCGLFLQKGAYTRENSISGFFLLAELSATCSLGSHESFSSSLSALGQGSTTPGTPILKPKHGVTGVVQTIIEQTWHGHFPLLKEGLHYPLLAPRRPGWGTSVGMFSNLITYPCLKLFMVH